MGWKRIVVLLRLRELLFKDFPELVEVRLPAAAGELNHVQEELAADVWVLVVMASHNTAASTAIWECNAIGSRQQSTNPWITYGGVQQGNAAESTPRTYHSPITNEPDSSLGQPKQLLSNPRHQPLDLFRRMSQFKCDQPSLSRRCTCAGAANQGVCSWRKHSLFCCVVNSM